MAKFILSVLMMVCLFSVQAQPYTATTVEKLDLLEQNRVLLTKQIEVTKLQAELQKANEQVGMTTGVAATGSATGAATGSALHLIKIAGLASKPEAVFLYGGYRVVADKGEMVIPNIQLTSVTQSYVVLKDITTGKESILWLSAEDTTAAATKTP